MSELLPCPFCGRKPEIIHHDTKKEATWCEWEIECTHGYQKPTIQGEDGDEWCFDFAYAGDNLETVIKHWNTRHERTCQMTDNRSGEYASYDCQEHCYICSSCYSEFTLIYLYEDGGSSCEMPVYCPTCGAKVVDP